MKPTIAFMAVALLTVRIADAQTRPLPPELDVTNRTGRVRPVVMVTNLPAEKAQALKKAAEQRRAAFMEERAKAAKIELTENGAVGRFGPHRVEFAPNPRTAVAIDLRMPDGQRLQSHVLGLCYMDDSGKSVLIAGVKDCTGEVVETNKVVYRDAFDSGVAADLIYEYTYGSLEQNVVIRKRLPAPSEYGFTNDDGVRLAVMTEFVNPPQPRKTSETISLREHYRDVGLERDESLADETLDFGPRAMRIVPGKAFSLEGVRTNVPVAKDWRKLRGPDGAERQFLIEFVPFPLVKPQLEALPKSAAVQEKRNLQNLEAVLLACKPPPKNHSPGGKTFALASLEKKPGFVLDYLIVNNHVLNVNFGNDGKTGLAAIGQVDGWQWSSDYWNAYIQPGTNYGILENLLWSDRSESGVNLTVENAPGIAEDGYGTDVMYSSFIYPEGGDILTTIANLPPGTYDFFVYATRGTEAGAPLIQLQCNGARIGMKSTTLWGNNWYSHYWDEYEQYVRFRNVTVGSGANVVLAVSYCLSGLATLSGLQIVPTDSIPVEESAITDLLNVDFGGYSSNKVGVAAVGLTTNDVWNGYYYPGQLAVAVPNLKWSDGSTNGVGMIVLDGNGSGSNNVPDVMFRTFVYSQTVGTQYAGNITITLTNLPAGVCDVYLYGHNDGLSTNGYLYGYWAGDYDWYNLLYEDNAVFELWSDNVNWGTKGTSVRGLGPTQAAWEVGQQYVLFKDVTVRAGLPLVIHAKAKHTGWTDGLNNVSGLQIAYTGALDTDADGLPDGWERRFFDSLQETGYGNPDGDELTNRDEYKLGRDPMAFEWCDYDPWRPCITTVWVEDDIPGGYESYWGGYGNEWNGAWGEGYWSPQSWNWMGSLDGDENWGLEERLPNSGEAMHVTWNSEGILQSYFFSSPVVLRPLTGDVLFAWVNLDTNYPPEEVMLQWYVVDETGRGSWAHRAYWGADLINTGTNGTASRYRAGDLPGSGWWSYVDVPASAVGLEGKIIEGMALTLYGGQAVWDRVGKLSPKPPQPPDKLVSVVASTLTAKESGLVPGAFTVHRETTNASAALTVTVTISGTASNGVDYATITNQITIPAGQTSTTVNVTPLEDNLVESDESVTLTISTNAGYIVGAPHTATATIEEKPTVNVTASDADAGERCNNGEFTITRDGPTNTAMTVTFTMVGTATNGLDYAWLPCSVTIPAGRTNKTIMLSPLYREGTQGTRTGILSLQNSTAYTVVNREATVSIADALDSPTCASAPSGLIGWWPGGGNAQDAVNGAIGELGWYTTYGAGKVGSTFVMGSNQYAGVTLPYSETYYYLQDFTMEGWVRRQNTTAATSDAAATYGTILAQGWWSHSFAMHNDGRLGLVLIGPSTAVYSTLAVTDTNWHHVAVSKTSTNVVFYLDGMANEVGAFDPGFWHSMYLAIGRQCNVFEGWYQPFLGAIDEVSLYNRSLSAAEIQAVYMADSAGKCMPQPVASVIASDAVAGEPNNDGLFRIRRKYSISTALTVAFTLGGAAQNGTDYTVTNSSAVTIPAGSTSTLLKLSPVDDGLVESNEMVTLTILTNSAYGIEDPGMAMVMLWDKTVVSVSASDADAGEPSNNGVFTITRTGATDIPVTVSLALSGAAQNGVDYSVTNSSAVTIPAGQQYTQLTLATIDRDGYQVTRTATLNLVDGAGYAVGTREAVVYITDNDSYTDADGDELPDAWETGYFNTLSRDGHGDYDGDGVSDLEEFRGSTNPCCLDSNGDGVMDQGRKAQITRPSTAASGL